MPLPTFLSCSIEMTKPGGMARFDSSGENLRFSVNFTSSAPAASTLVTTLAM